MSDTPEKDKQAPGYRTSELWLVVGGLAAATGLARAEDVNNIVQAVAFIGSAVSSVAYIFGRVKIKLGKK